MNSEKGLKKPLGVIIWAIYAIVKGIVILVPSVFYFIKTPSNIETPSSKLLFFNFLYVYTLLVSIVALMSGIGLFKLNNLARKGIILLAILYLIGAGFSILLIFYYSRQGINVTFLSIKTLFQTILAIGILHYFNKVSTKELFAKSK